MTQLIKFPLSQKTSWKKLIRENIWISPYEAVLSPPLPFHSVGKGMATRELQLDGLSPDLPVRTLINKNEKRKKKKKATSNEANRPFNQM